MLFPPTAPRRPGRTAARPRTVRRTLAAAALLVSAAAPPARAQGTRADYDRAAGLRQLVAGKVVRDRVAPHWLPGDRFWYRADLPGGSSETWLVDMRSGTKAPYTPSAPESSGDLRPRSPEGLRSRDGGGETEIRFANRSGSAVRLFWLDGEGERHPYGTLAPGEVRAQHTFAGHAWLVTTEDGRPLAAFTAEESAAGAVITGAAVPAAPVRSGPSPGAPLPGTSPDGKWTALLKEHNLWLRETDSGRERALTTDGTAERFLDDPLAWSPDSRRLVAFRTVPAQHHLVHFVESSPPGQVQPKLHSIEYLKPGDRIRVSVPCLFDAFSGREIPIRDGLFPTPWSISEVRWEPDSRRFTFLYNQRGHQALRIIAVDGETGEARAVVNEESRTFIDYAGKFFCRYLDRTGEILWMSERDGWNHLYLYDAQSGRVKNAVTHGAWVVLGVDRVDPEKRQVWFHAGGLDPAQDPYYVHYCRVNFDGTGLVRLTRGDGTHSLEHSPDGRFYLDRYSRVDLPPVTELRRSDDGSLVMEVERGDWSALLATGWKVPERFSAKGRDGVAEIYGVLFRPTTFDPAKQYPVIEDIYAGPQSSFVPKAFLPLHSQQELAELGFIVVKIDGMGTSNRSKRFHDVCWKNLGDAGLPDRILWMRAAAARDPSLDLTRVGIYGTSAGGQNALRALLAHPEFYRVGVSACGCHDNRMDKIWWNELWMGWPVGPHYDEQSNVTQADRLEGKLLLIVGEMDTNVDPASTLQVVDRLVKANRDFELLVVPGAGHGMGGAYGRRRMEDFFVRHLLGVEPRRADP